MGGDLEHEVDAWQRRRDASNGSLFGYVDLEARVPADHPLRTIRDLTNAALLVMSGSSMRRVSLTTGNVLAT